MLLPFLVGCGWGLYFTGTKGIAEHYRKGLSHKALINLARETYDEGFSGDEAFDELMDSPNLSDANRELLLALKEDDFLGFDYPHQAISAAFRDIYNFDPSDRLREAVAAQGNLYEAEIPEDGEYLLWDKPLSEQPEKVKAALATNPGGIDFSDPPAKMTGADAYKLLVDFRDAGVPRSQGQKAASATLHEAGIAGIKYLDGPSRSKGDGSFNYVLFDDSKAEVVGKFSIPEDAGPARGLLEPGGRSEEIDAAALALGDALRKPESRGNWREKLEDLRIALQDKMLPVLRMQEAVSRQVGRSLAEHENPYLSEELMHGRIGSRLEGLFSEHVEPLLETMYARDVEAQDFEDYLYARHAPERNAQMATINPEFADGGGSGMTDIEARAVMNRIAKAGKTEAMEDLAGRYDAMLAEGVARRIESGLLSQEDADHWRTIYPNYAPLRGRNELDTGFDDGIATRMQRQSGISVKGKESRRAFGRRSRADDILAHSILIAEEAIVRSEQNRVARSFLDLAKASPDANFWTIDKIERKRRINPTTGMVELYTDSRISAEDAPFTVSLKVDGVEHRVTMNRDNPAAVKVADAMRNLSAVKWELLVQTFGKVTRAFSAINTRLSPPFIITNAVRDAMTASTTLQQYEDLPGLTRKVLGDWRKALTAPRDGDSEWAKWRREWELAGGKVAFNNTQDLKMIRDDLHKRIGRLTNPTIAKQAWGKFWEGVDAANDSVERAVRLAVFKNAREMGRSKAEAASMALNVTVNFTRKGQYGPALNAFYAFFNASTQGSATLVMAAARSKKVRRAMAAFVVAGLLSDLLNAMLSDDDDDGQSFWDKIPAHEKSRNIILMIPGTGGNYVKLPLAYGLNALFGFGRNSAAMMRGALDPGKAAIASVLEVADAFNPIGSGGSWLNILAPTLLDPLVELTVNRDFTGRPIQPEANPFESPETPSNNFFPSVSTQAKWLAQGLNAVTGGDEVIPGALSVSPEVLDYVFGYLTGGAGRFVGDVTALPLSLLDPSKETTVNEWPMVDKLVGQTPDWVDRSMFYERVRSVEGHIDHTKQYLDTGNADGASAYAERHADELSLEAAVKRARHDMRDIRKEKSSLAKLLAAGEIDQASFDSEQQVITAAEKLVVDEFNTQWVQTIIKPPKPE